MTDRSDLNLISMTVDITSAYLNHNPVAGSELPAVIESIHAALDKARHPETPELVNVPAVPVRGSIKPDYIICLEDGKKLKMLKRYLRTQHNLSPEEYREKWGLPKDYPMVAPSYAARRTSIALEIGLGNKRTEAAGTTPGATAISGHGESRAADVERGNTGSEANALAVEHGPSAPVTETNGP